MTKTKFHSSVIFVRNIEKAKQFYTELLNCTIEHDFGKNVILNDGLSLWELREKHIIARELKVNVVSNKFELYFENEDIESVFENLKKHNVKFLHEIHEEPWGQRTIRFFDYDGHLIEIGEPLVVFVRNMKNNGLNDFEIADKSGIPLETVIELIKS